MFFHTGPAFYVAILVFVAIIILGCAALTFIPRHWVLQLITALCVSASLWWVPFWLDRKLMRKRKTGSK